MLPQFEYGAQVRVVRNVRNDGSYPGMDTGALLVRRGSVGYVRDVGTYLLDQIIYSVHFVDAGRVVGCREEELIAASAPWVATDFDVRDRVATVRPLGIGGRVVVAAGSVGEVIRVVPDVPNGPAYHVRFPGRTLLVPEAVLAAAARD